MRVAAKQTRSARGHMSGRPSRDETSVQARSAVGALTARAKSRNTPALLAAASAAALVAGQFAAGAAAPAAMAATSLARQPMSPGLAAQLSTNVNQHVIVIMKGQLAAAHVGSHAATTRAAAIASTRRRW